MNRRIKTLTLLLLWALLLTAFGCSFASDPEDADSLDSFFLSFNLLSADNPELTSDVIGYMDGDSIYLDSNDTWISSYNLIPSFYTDAVSVEVNGESQESGLSSQDFSSAVEYTLTDSAGRVSVVSAVFSLNKAWVDMGTTPVPFTGGGIYGLACGLIDDSYPYVILNTASDGTGEIHVHRFDTLNGDWVFHDPAGGEPNDVVSFGAASLGSTLVVVYEDSAVGDIFYNSTDTGSGWNGNADLDGGNTTSGTRDLQLVQAGDDTTLYAAWIEDPGVSDEVWTYKYAFGVWTPLPVTGGGGSLASYSVNNMAIVAGGGTDLWLACTLDENPGVLHYCKYDFVADDWSDMKVDGSSSENRDENLEIVNFFYDSDEDRPVLFVCYPLDSGFSYELRALYWDDNAGVWTNRNYIEPLGIASASQLDGLALSWNESKNIPTAVVGAQVYTWDGIWKSKGDEFDSFDPGDAAVLSAGDDLYMVGYVDDLSTDALSVKARM